MKSVKVSGNRFVLLGLLVLFALPAVAFATEHPTGPSYGPKDAPVTAVIYYDFQCGYCGRTAPVLLEVVKEYKGLVRLVTVNVPGPGHPYAEPAAQFALTANEKGKFWEAFTLLFENQSNLSNEDLAGYAKKLGLDENTVLNNIENHTFLDQLKTNFYTAIDIGLRATPVIFINETELVGQQDANALRYYFNEELAKKKIKSPVGPVPKPEEKKDTSGEQVPKNMIFPVKVVSPTDSKLKVKVGNKALDFSLPTLDDEKVTLSQFIGKKNLVLSFVPAAWTPVCSEQWPEYNENKDVFDQANAALVGISTDNIPSLYSWTGTMGELWFTVASDFYPHGELAGKLGVLRSNGVSERAVFVIDSKGVIRYIEVHDINSKPNFKNLKKALKELQ